MQTLNVANPGHDNTAFAALANGNPVQGDILKTTFTVVVIFD